MHTSIGEWCRDDSALPAHVQTITEETSRKKGSVLNLVCEKGYEPVLPLKAHCILTTTGMAWDVVGTCKRIVRLF